MPGGSPSRFALQTAGLLSTFLSRLVQVALACVGPLEPVLLCAGGHVSRGAPVCLGRLQGRDSCCCVTPVQVAKASEALAAKTRELAAKAAEMEALQQRFNEEHAELGNLQANEDEVRVGGRIYSAGGRVVLLMLQGTSNKAQQAVASVAAVTSCFPPCWGCTLTLSKQDQPLKPDAGADAGEVHHAALSQKHARAATGVGTAQQQA